MSENFIQRIYRFYTSDLEPGEFNRFVKGEANQVYRFYSKDHEAKDKEKKNGLVRFFSIAKHIILAFLKKLSPIRRIIFSAAIVLFIMGSVTEIYDWVLLAFIVLVLLLAFEVAEKITAKSEVDIARQIIMDLMPEKAPLLEHYDIACHAATANEVGGDYFDFFKAENNSDKFYTVIGDISGSGMEAALNMVQVQALLRNMFVSPGSLKDIMTELNSVLNRTLGKKYFFTTTMTSLDSKGRLKICRAGHTPAILYRAAAGEAELIKPGGIGMGMRDGGLFASALKEERIKMESGDILVLSTDGITEAHDHTGEEFGERRIISTLKKHADKPAEKIKANLLGYLNLFTQSATPTDDVTLVIIKAR